MSSAQPSSVESNISDRSEIQRIHDDIKKLKEELIISEDYLDKVKICFGGEGEDESKPINEYPDLADKLMYPSSSDEGNVPRELTLFTDAKQQINELVKADFERLESKNISSPKWTECLKGCKTTLSKLIKDEIESTAYILRVLSNSVLSVEDTNNELIFHVDGDNDLLEKIKNGVELTGRWEHDKQFFKLKPLGDPNRPTRLIMAFGPSASGKTVLGATIVKLISENANNATFPKTFLKIDGGDMRTYSMMYQYIINTITSEPYNTRISGYSNLVAATLADNIKSLGKNPSLFDSGIVKKTIKTYLTNLRDNEKFSISLYIPETIAWCGGRDCQKKYKKYIEISKPPAGPTGAEAEDDWVGLYIYQHKCTKGCSNTCTETNPNYKCETTTESGSAREKTEGKKYSSGGYDAAEKNGLIEIKKAPGGRIIIHSSGRKDGVSRITEYDIDNRQLLAQNNEEIEVSLGNSNVKVYIEHKASDDGNNNSNIPKNFKSKESKSNASDPKVIVTDSTVL